MGSWYGFGMIFGMQSDVECWTAVRLGHWNITVGLWQHEMLWHLKQLETSRTSMDSFSKHFQRAVSFQALKEWIYFWKKNRRKLHRNVCFDKIDEASMKKTTRSTLASPWGSSVLGIHQPEQIRKTGCCKGMSANGNPSKIAEY